MMATLLWSLWRFNPVSWACTSIMFRMFQKDWGITFIPFFVQPDVHKRTPRWYRCSFVEETPPKNVHSLGPNPTNPFDELNPTKPSEPAELGFVDATASGHVPAARAMSPAAGHISSERPSLPYLQEALAQGELGMQEASAFQGGEGPDGSSGSQPYKVSSSWAEEGDEFPWRPTYSELRQLRLEALEKRLAVPPMYTPMYTDLDQPPTHVHTK